MVCIDVLKRDFPDVFNGNSLLYIGASPSRWTNFLDLFNMAKWEPTVLELDPRNVLLLQEMNLNVIAGDVRNIEKLVGVKSFDVIIWEDGPEHIYAKDFDSTIPQLLQVARQFVIMEAPEGRRGHSTTAPILDQQLSEIYLNTFNKYGIKSFLLPKKVGSKDMRVFSIAKLSARY